MIINLTKQIATTHQQPERSTSMGNKSEVVARVPTAPTKPKATPVTDELTVKMVRAYLDELTVKMVRDYLDNLSDNAARVAMINGASDAVVTLSRDSDVGCDTLRFTRTVFAVGQEHFTYVSTIGNGWYVRAATPDERALLP